MFLYLVFFGFTWLELPWLYPAEINPLRTRTNANSVSTICNWSFNFGVVMATPPLLTAINWGTFLIFGVLNVLFIPFIWIYYPETAGRLNLGPRCENILTGIVIFQAALSRKSISYLELRTRRRDLTSKSPKTCPRCPTLRSNRRRRDLAWMVSSA